MQNKIIVNFDKDDLYIIKNKAIDIFYNNIKDKLFIVDNNNIKQELLIKYGCSNPITILYNNFVNGNFLKYIYDDIFIYKIGDHIKDSKRDFIIIDRNIILKESKNGEIIKEKNYLCYCNNCGYKGWKTENRIKNSTDGCPECYPIFKRVTYANNITITDPWMIPYFPGNTYEEKMKIASQFTANSDKKMLFQCPDCKEYSIKPKSISNLHKNHSIGCKCSDHKSYPNKFSYCFLNQLPIENWEFEYSPEWAKPYFYDNYFEYKGRKYILEMDGGLGHGKRKIKSPEKDIIGLERDKIKEKLANENNITVIRINAEYSNKEYLSNQILNNKTLNNIFEEKLKDIDWNECEKSALKNIVKEVCEFWENNDHPEYSVIKEKFNIKFNGTIQDYLKKGTEFGWCYYNKDEYRKERQRKSLGKTISVYLLDGTYLKTYNSYSELKRDFYNDFGVKVGYAKVKDVINGVLKEYKKFIFKEND